MTKSTDNSSKTKQSLMANLFSTKPQEVLAALSEIPDRGDASFVQPLLKTYVAWENDLLIRDKVSAILYELKTVAAIPELIKALDAPELQAEKPFVLSIFWNAGLIPTEIDVLVRHALHGGYMTAFEVLTILEQMEASADADAARDAVLDVEEFLDDNADCAHVEILEQIRFVLIEYSNL